MSRERLERNRLVEGALAAAGLDDLGEPTWQEGLDCVLDALVEEARLHALGLEIVASEIVTYLANRAAIVVQTHRDPLKVIASVSALATHLRRLASDQGSVAEAAVEYADEILLGLERAMQARDAATVPPSRIIDVHFTEFVADPLATIRTIYNRLDMPLSDECEARMRAFLVAHPGDGGGAGTRYRFSDTGLDADELRERAAAYQERFGVEVEPVR